MNYTIYTIYEIDKEMDLLITVLMLNRSQHNPSSPATLHRFSPLRVLLAAGQSSGLFPLSFGILML